MFRTLTFVFLFLFASASIAQITKAGLSPRVKVSQQVGLANITLDYGRPDKRDRPIFGHLIPYGKVWRTGANSSTKFSVDTEIQLGGHQIPAGDYAIYSIPNEKEWTIIISKNTELWGAGGYDSKDDLLRFQTKVNTLNDLRETFSIHFENFNANGSDLIIEWEYAQIRIPVFIDTDALVYKEIEEKVIKANGQVSAASYYDAAQFYYEKGKDLDQAVKWFDKAIELRPSAFWYHYYRAEIAYTMGDMKTAKSVVEACLKMAAESPADYGYIAKCNLLLEQLN